MPGGVCAVLDYEVELMAEYVAEMTSRLAMGTATAPVAFRKFISQILSSTRLPSTTILLGMNYLSKRINMLSLGGAPKMSDGQMWRLLTVSLLLGSKFLDDNTFQNRSWAEVSGIPVRELNNLEYEWMDSVGWNLFVNLDRSEDYNAWLKSWRDWSDNKKRQQAMASRDRLTSLVSPIETDMSRSRQSPAYNAWHQQQVAEFERYERLSTIKRNEQTRQPPAYRTAEPTWAPFEQQHMASWPTSPLTPPDSGYGTPDYMGSATSANSHYNDWFSQQQNRAMAVSSYARPQQYHNQTCATQSNNFQAQNPPSYPFNFHSRIWGNHSPNNCRCSFCASSPQHKQQPYFNVPPSYGQPVA